MSSANAASSSSTTATPLQSYYFFQSPYLSKEMESCFQNRIRIATLATRGVTQLHRLRRGDMQCSYLMDERQRVAVAQGTDRILQKNGMNSCAMITSAMNTNGASSTSNSSSSSSAAASSPSSSTKLLATPTHPIFLYWTDGAKRTLPFILLKSVALKRGAAKVGRSLDVNSATAAGIIPDRIISILGGSNALQCKLLDEKCAMQELLSKKWYVPHTRSFDITKEGWKEILEEVFRSGVNGNANAAAADSQPTRYLILKPSLGHKQRGILILPHSPSYLATALSHVQSQLRPGGQRGIFETWVIQEYVKEPLCVSGVDIGMLFEHGKEVREKGVWRKWMEGVNSGNEAEEKQQQPSSSTPSTTLAAKPSSKPNSRRSTGSNAPITIIESTKRRSSPNNTAASSSATAAAASRPPSTIRHTLTISYPYLPSDSSHPVHMSHLYKIHFRVFSMVRYDTRTRKFEVYVCNLSKVYHATEPMAMLELKGIGKSGKEHDEAAEKYLLAQAESATSTSSTPSSADSASSSAITSSLTPSPAHPPLFSPLSSFPPTHITLSPSFHSPSLSSSISVSKYLAMRLAHHIFPEEKLSVMMQGMSEIIVDSVRECIDAGGMKPCGGFSGEKNSSDNDDIGLSTLYFQYLGYDFLWDTVTNKPVLLEVNNNVGQGLMSQEVMSKQEEKESGVTYGLSNQQYNEMREYWREYYRIPFIESSLKLTVDRFHDDASAATANDDDVKGGLPLGSKEPIRFMSSPPKKEENCWILADVYQRKSKI